MLGIVMHRSKVDGGHRPVVELRARSRRLKDVGAAPKKVKVLVHGRLTSPEFMQCAAALGVHRELVVDVHGCLKSLIPHGAWQMTVGEERSDHGHDGEIKALSDAVELRGVCCNSVMCNATLAQQLVKSG